LLASTLPFPTEWVHDEWLAIVAAATGEVRLLDEPLIDYRQHDENAIGAGKPTLGYRFGRMIAPRGTRYADLAARSAVLTARLDSLDVPERWRTLAQAKAAFEARRAAYPKSRLARVGAVLHERRSYSTLSSQGSLDVVRDLIQPA
jgi:hypothetical protein